jgi:hypothetical protein
MCSGELALEGLNRQGKKVKLSPEVIVSFDNKARALRISLQKSGFIFNFF